MSSRFGWSTRGRRGRRGAGALLAAGLSAALVVGPPGAAPGGAAGGRTGTAAQAALTADDVRLNEIQTVGSHNSYHLVPSAAEVALRRSVIGAEEDALQYLHAPLPQQFASQKVRQIELDVFVDGAGGRYAEPLLRGAAGVGPYDPAMREPGIKVLHVQDVDYASTCLSLRSCLQAVKGWSDANPSHVPIAVMLELKDSPLVVGDLEFTEPEPWDVAAMDALDAEIRSVFPEDRMITPDDVRGERATLEEAVLTDGWPTLGESRGQVLFLMDNGGGYRTDYLAGHPSLEGRVLFTNADPGQPDAAFVKRNDATDEEGIQALVAQGYVVRTRADAETVQARTGDTTLRDAALRSGAQWVSSDYPAPGLAYGFTSDYAVEIPGGTVARCNPVSAPPGCVSADLESIEVQVPPTTVPPTTAPPPTAPPPSTVAPGVGAPGVPVARPATGVRARPGYTG